MLKELYRRILGKGSIDEMEMKKSLKDLQRALIAADVDVKLVLEKTKEIEKRYRREAPKSLSTGKLLAKLIHEELGELFGEEGKVTLKPQKIMLVGLYGAGKTTTAGKLALYFSKRGLKTILASVDFDRPAGREQLRQLAEKVGVTYIDGESVEDIVGKLTDVWESKRPVIILDTPGRNAFDEELLEELRRIRDLYEPHLTLFVASADVGSIIKKHVERLSSKIPIDGLIITKFEGSGKGGGALSAARIVKAPIYFLGTGEKLDELEEFSRERVVNKILGIPQMKDLVEEIKKMDVRPIDDEFSLVAFQQQMKALGNSSLGKLFGNIGMDLPQEVIIKGEKELRKMDAIINSMTPYERQNPEVVVKSPSRIRRIAKGSGTTEQEVKKLLKQFFKAKKLFKKMRRNRGLFGKLQQLMGG